MLALIFFLSFQIAFVEAIRRNPRDLTNLLCQTDILRAAAYLQSNSNSIQMLASEIASDRDFKVSCKGTCTAVENRVDECVVTGAPLAVSST